MSASMTTTTINRTSASIYRFNAAEATRRRPKKEYIFSSCSPESIAMLIGGGGLGKSYLALQLMVTLALADNSKLAAWALAFNVVDDTLKLSHLPRSMFKRRGVKVSHC